MWSKMVDLEMDDEDQIDAVCPMPVSERPRYPYGLRICLTKSELDKLDLEPDCAIGDVIDLRAFAVVTSVSKSETMHGGEDCRVELQIQKLAIEDEAKED